MNVVLREVNTDTIVALTLVARQQALPYQVMPTDDKYRQWNCALEERFVAFHHNRRLDPTKRTFVIDADNHIVGSIRLDDTPVDGVVETGMWLGATARGKSFSTAALVAVIRIAHDTQLGVVVAYTTHGNVAAQRALSRAGAIITYEGNVVCGTFREPDR